VAYPISFYYSGGFAQVANRPHNLSKLEFKEVRNALLQQKPDIIQFVGHGIYRDGKGYLALVDDETGATLLVDDGRFANLFLGFDDHLGLVSLATCESAKSDSPQSFLGIAPKSSFENSCLVE
jgi:hypothetical protein